jgi:uncharacterized protein
MKRRSVAGALMLLACLQPGSPAPAGDFLTAYKAYTEGHYDEARAEFLQLAQLGNAGSQFDLGAMALHGQGGPKDLGAAVGWLTAAADNGDTQLAPEKLAQVRATLTDEQLRTAEDIVSRYGHAGLLKTVLPAAHADARCSDIVRARFLQVDSRPQNYPWWGQSRLEDGFVIVEVSVGADGVARDPEVLMAAPSQAFPPSAVHIAMTARYQPATRAGRPIESKFSFKLQYVMHGGSLWNLPKLKNVRELAAQGVPAAEYLVGLAATLDGSLQMSAEQAQALLLSAAQGGDARAQYWEATRFMDLGACESSNKALPWLDAAAGAGHAGAQLALAMQLLQGTPGAEQLTHARSLLENASASDDFYVRTHVTALLAASPFEAVRDAGKARTVAEKLDKDPMPSDPQLFEAIAAACAANGDFEKAAARQERAIGEAESLQWTNLGEMQARLAAYHASKPWTGDLFAQ